MGRPFIEYVDDETFPKFICANCSSDVASSSALIWEGYMGIQQPAYLFRETVNVGPCSSEREERLATGVYTLVDVQCQCCSHVLGWKYIRACNYEQKYKEGGTLMQQDALQRVNTASKGTIQNAGNCDY